MKLNMSKLFVLLLCLVFPIMAFADQFEDAKTAIESEDFSKAMKLLLPLTEENNTDAQTLLGVLYINGQGVEKDFNKGLSLIMNAAAKGNDDARTKAFMLCLDLANQGDTLTLTSQTETSGGGGPSSSKTIKRNTGGRSFPPVTFTVKRAG